MTVTINTLGTNSRQIVIDSETSATNIINAVNTCLVAMGWTLIDTVTSGSRGLLTTRVYSAPNADTVTTKYMIIRYDLPRQYWFVSCAENFNTVTHVATNECWYSNRQILLPLQYSNTVLYVFATERYACFMGVVNSEPSAWQGVFEFERYATEDIANKDTPCFGWTSSLTIGEPYGNIMTPGGGGPAAGTTSANNGTVAIGFAVPRTKNNLTGNSAAGVFNVLTSLGAFPPTKSQSNTDFNSGGLTQTLNSHCGMLGTWGDSSTYVWDANKVPISNLQLNGYGTLYLLGRIYGLKITAKLGAVLDTTMVPVDSNLFYSSTGTNANHYLLGIHGQYCDRLAAGSNRLVANTVTLPANYGVFYQMVLVSGRYLYFTTSTGFHKFDTQTNSITANILPAGQYYNVKFDGENNLYVTAAAANIIYRINLTNDTNTTLSMTGTWCGLAIDDDNLYVGSPASGTTSVVKRVALSTFTEAASYTVTGGGTNFITHISTGDYAGFLYVGTMGVLAASTNRVTRINVSNATQTFLTVPAQLGPNGAPGYAQPLFFDGNKLWFFRWNNTASASGQNGIMYIVRLSDFSQFGEISNTVAISNFTSFTSSLTTIAGLELPSFAGMTFNIYGDGTTFGAYRFVFSDPRVSSIQAIPGNAQQISAVATQMYTTDQSSLYGAAGSGTTTTITRYTNTFRTYNFNGVQTSNILIAQ